MHRINYLTLFLEYSKQSSRSDDLRKFKESGFDFAAMREKILDSSLILKRRYFLNSKIDNYPDAINRMKKSDLSGLLNMRSF